MQLGMPTLIELDGLEANAKLCKDLGLSFVEINMNLPEYRPNQLKAEELIKLQKKYDIFFSFHLPDDFDITHFNQDIRQAHIKFAIETIELMKQIKSPLINMHMNIGTYFTLPTKKIYLYEKYQDVCSKNYEEFARKVVEVLAGTEIKFAIENTGIFDVAFILSRLEALLSRKEFVLTWDIGHDFTSGYRDRDCIQRYAHKIKHMHLHDACDSRDHLPLFEGQLDLHKYIDFANERDLTVVLETKTIEGLKKSVSALKNR